MVYDEFARNGRGRFNAVANRCPSGPDRVILLLNAGALIRHILVFRRHAAKPRERGEPMPPRDKAPAEPAVWRQPDGTPLACEDKIDVLRENLAEIQEICQEALEDALVMEVDEAQFRQVLHTLVDGLVNPYEK